MSVLGRIAKQISEYHNGRISVFHSCWVWPNQAGRGKESRFDSLDVTGRAMTLISRKAVGCPNPEVGKPYPQTNDKPNCWFVPLKACQSCQHHRKSRRGANYRHCEYARQLRGGNDGALNAANTMMGSAMSVAREIMNGK